MVESSSHEVPPSIVAFCERLSPRVRAALPHWKWKWHPEWRSSCEELQRELSENGIPEWPFLWPLEEAFAGAEVELGGWQLSFGITAESPYIKRRKLADEHDQTRLVALGDYGNDILVTDATGRIYVLEEDGVLTALAPSFESFLEYHAMSTWFADWSPTLVSADFLPRATTSALASHLGVSPVPEAFNDIFRWWQDEALTLFAWVNDDLPAMMWAKTLAGLVKCFDAAVGVCPTLKIKPAPSYDGKHVEILEVGEIRARAPSVSALAARPGARRVELLGEPSLYKGKPPSTGDVWISGEGETLRIDVLERREGEVVNYWELTPTGSHALLISTYGRG